MVDEELVLELKAIFGNFESQKPRVVMYLKAAGHSVGRLINLHSARSMDGVKRIVN